MCLRFRLDLLGIDDGVKYLLPNALQCVPVFITFGAVIVNVRPTRRGFFCDDPSIRYPYKDDTVTGWMLVSGSFLLPLVIVRILGAYCLKRYYKQAYLNTWLKWLQSQITLQNSLKSRSAHLQAYPKDQFLVFFRFYFIPSLSPTFVNVIFSLAIVITTLHYFVFCMSEEFAKLSKTFSKRGGINVLLPG